MTDIKRSLLVLSPHLDDAVLSCGLLLAAHPGAVVCTAFSGHARGNMSTGWDRASGFANAHEAMSGRKFEDRRALAILNAQPLHLPFCDAQYESSPTLELLVDVFSQTIRNVNPDTVLLPLGLFHSDHVLVANACLAVPESVSGASFYAYEEVPYRHISQVVQTRVIELAEQGWTTTPSEPFDADLELNPVYEEQKHAAIRAYRSQLKAFGPEGKAGLFYPERYWKIYRERKGIEPLRTS